MKRLSSRSNSVLLVVVVALAMTGVAPLESANCFAQSAAESSSTGSTTAASDANPNRAAIQSQSQEFIAAFNRKDADAIAKLWTENGEYIDETGNRLAGRDEIQKAYAALFAENPKATLKISIDSLQLLSDGAALEDGRATVQLLPDGDSSSNTYSAIHVKTDGKWLLASVRDNPSEVDSSMAQVSDLEFLIGTWIAEEHGNRMESVCRWVADKNFVERQYTTTMVNGRQISGVQIIGWNPLNGFLQSWDFSPDGGHAVGVWSPVEGGWSADVQGTTGDGTPTASVNILKRLDDNAYVWRSLERLADGVSLPDTGEVVLKRKPKGH